ncbi:hypothetical protein L9F63_016982, partial [Diploptera punctata]
LADLNLVDLQLTYRLTANLQLTYRSDRPQSCRLTTNLQVRQTSILLTANLQADLDPITTNLQTYNKPT